MKATALAILLFLILAGTDGSQDAALYVAEENGLPTIQSAVDAIYWHDGPHTIRLQAGITYTESVSFDSCRPIWLDGQGVIWAIPDGAKYAIKYRNCGAPRK